MRLHWDLTQGYIVRTPKSSTRLITLEFKRGDAASLELVFYADAMPVLLQPGHAIRFALKPKGHYDGEPLVYTATFTENANAKTYTAEPSFNTAALTALFASPNAPDRVDLIGEFSLRNGDDTHGWQSSQTFNVSVINDVIRGQEGTPGAATDAQQSWQWLLASLAAGTNLTFTPNHETRVLTLAAVAGASGNGWSPLFGIVSDGERRLLQLTSWVGGTGDEPQGSGYYLGDAGLVANIGDAVDVRGTSGSNGLNGTNGQSGSNGWSPMFTLINEGERRVLQLTAWTGGTGDAPQGVGNYLGSSGLVTSISDAVDLRGAVGAAGGPGANGLNGINGLDGNHGWTPALALFSDGERRVLQLTGWTGGSGSPPQGIGSYLGVSGWVATAAEALDLRGMQGPSGSTGAAGADVTPITSISFDGTNLTIQTSTGQSFGPFMVKGNDGGNGTNGINGIDGINGTNGWTPVFAIISDGERRVLQLQNWTGGSGSTPGSEGYYLGASGLTPNLYDAVDVRGPRGSDGSAGTPGTNGVDATPITSISFDGTHLTIQTSTGQSFGPFYVRGNDGSSGSTGAPGNDATPITSINFDGANLTIQTSTGQSFGPFYVRGSDGSNGSSGSDGANGNNGWSPLFTAISDGERRVLQLQSWTGGNGSTPGYEGYYLGASGFTPNLYDATDIRGERGSDGAPGADGGNGGSTGADGANGWSPLFIAISDGERRVLQLQNWTGGSGSTPGSEGYYLGADGFTPYLYEAVDLRGASGSDGSNGADATPITNIDFDGSNLTFYTSTGQSFGPFYVRGSDGPPGADGGYGGSNGADGANGWSPQLAIVLDGERHVLQLQSWVGGGGSTPGNEGSYLGPYGYTTSISEAVDIRGSLQPLAPIDNVNGTASLSGSDTVDVAQLEAQIADLQTKLQLVLDRLRSHNLISMS
ncbi:MAG: hypothetical protein K9N47_16700 [Prosthecobacter sp.]|uniref:hypothetical protein n=1 Tax=Prosthecobacter sp. TaxID=1965333 RepID=UPI0025CD0646|nr:hypothetical protein [Prosthecobacter sp.]MCF7787771.1 hypothetical protein [Prosthecobacter sp.]